MTLPSVTGQIYSIAMGAAFSAIQTGMCIFVCACMCVCVRVCVCVCMCVMELAYVSFCGCGMGVHEDGDNCQR